MNEKERLQLENELLMTCSKAQAINKYIDELEESSKLSELWCKSQQENQRLKDRIEKAIEKVNNICIELKCKEASLYLKLKDIEQGKDLLEILKGDK